MSRCILALVVFSLVFASACGGDDTERRRNNDENACVPSCQSGFSCVAGTCYVRVQPEDCGEGEEFDPTYRVCLVPSCEDTVQNGSEEGVDCGGSCAPCDEQPADPSCDDGIQNGDEEGIDCGGGCELSCEDEPVVDPPTCDDQIQNGGEEGVDCGGPCEEACAAPTCDDGIQNGGEEGIDCGGPCEDACVIPTTCGDGQVQGDEQCDHGGSVQLSCPYGQTSCQVCNVQCELIAGQVSGYCGDGVVQAGAGEDCDHGGTPETSCGQGEEGCQVCNAQCELVAGTPGPRCGDGVVQSGETCDHGGTPETYCAYGEQSCQVCNAQCQQVAGQVQRCGDGVLQADEEECEGTNLGGATCASTGASGGTLSCNSNCTLNTTACVNIEIAELTSGFAHTCVRTTAGQVYCWGRNEDGRLGDGTTAFRTRPTLVPNLTNVTRISAGGYHTCAIQQGGTVLCWGGNQSGQLGDGTLADSIVPTPVLWSGTPPVVSSVSAGPSHTCAIASGGQAYCWGSDEFGKLGTGGIAPSSTPLTMPTAVAGLSDATQIHAGLHHSCARRQLSGRFVCWGRNSYGELGDADFFGSSSTSPRQVDDADYISGFLSGPYVAAGDRYSCARGSFGAVYCWGSPSYGQLGDLSVTSTRRANEIYSGMGAADFLSVGERHVCAVASGTVYCWGSGQYGRLGLGDTDNYFEPFDVTMPPAFDVQVGGMHTCARLNDGGVMCWGRNSHGQLGDGTQIDRTTPVRVRF